MAAEQHTMDRSTRTSCEGFFRLPDFPAELRQKIYSEYFGTWDAIIEYDKPSGLFKTRLPTFNLLLADRTTYQECSQLSTKSYSGKLILRDTKVPRESGFGFVSSLDVFASVTPKWVLEETELLAIEQGTTGMLMILPWFRLKSLREIDLEGSSWPLTQCHHCGISSKLREAQETNVLEGKYDTWCIHGYSRWSQVPKPISQGRVRVVTVRKGTVKGAFLKVRIEHREDSVEVLDRTINSVVQPKYAENTKPKADLSCHPM